MTAINGSRAKSIGITMLAGAIVSDFVIQKCAVRPPIPIKVNQGNAPVGGNFMSPS